MSLSWEKLAEPKSHNLSTSFVSFTCNTIQTQEFEVIKIVVRMVTHQNVVRFYVSMEDVASFHEFEGQEQLLGIRPHSLYVQTNILTITLQNFSQIHTERKRTKHRMSNTRDVHTYIQLYISINLRAKVHRLTSAHTVQHV